MGSIPIKLLKSTVHTEGLIAKVFDANFLLWNMTMLEG